MGTTDDAANPETRRADKRCDDDVAPSRDRELGYSLQVDGVEESLGADHKNWTGRNPDLLYAYVTGGILAQLIEEVRNQLGKAEECIAWYEREKEEYQQKLQTLLELEAIVQAQQAKKDGKVKPE